ncbi:PIN domain-containing protein [uncultured Sulfitobacter sp.]|uniref:type II toxin-antitoxin system VapC family toxin n=1 Tax=uncultured Sulfitobacter sp. TaxID=191468 RepID=UPI0026172801|nr:PIN domain-containing protein [uncultured Sulfitobacter sp.]
MILADTSVWIDHFRDPNPLLSECLRRKMLRTHPLVLAEIAMGSLSNRRATLKMLDLLKTVKEPSISEVRHFVEENRFYSRGIGFIDATLLAACKLTPGVRLWTRDRRVNSIAENLKIAYQPLH